MPLFPSMRAPFLLALLTDMTELTAAALRTTPIMEPTSAVWRPSLASMQGRARRVSDFRLSMDAEPGEKASPLVQPRAPPEGIFIEQRVPILLGVPLIVLLGVTLTATASTARLILLLQLAVARSLHRAARAAHAVTRAVVALEFGPSALPVAAHALQIRVASPHSTWAFNSHGARRSRSYATMSMTLPPARVRKFARKTRA